MNPLDIQSRIINYATTIEYLLVNFINKYPVKEKDKTIKSNNFILNKKSFTFEQKIRIFNKILKDFGDLKLANALEKGFHVPTEREELIKKIKYIKDTRNILAHNHPFTKKETREPYVEYTDKGKTEELILNEAFDKEFFRNYMYVDGILRDLIKFYNDNQTFKDFPIK